MLPYRSVNPTTEEIMYEKPETPVDEVFRIIERSYNAFRSWRCHPVAERAALFVRVAEILERDKAPLGRLLATEMGKPVAQGIFEAEKSAWLCRYYAEQAEIFLRDETVVTDASRSYVSFQPIGIVLGIMPWNFPLWQVFRYIVPAMIAGNTAILKHAPNVPMCAEAIDRLMREAGFPASVFEVVYVQPDVVARMIEHPYIQGVTLTGSARAGQAVAAKAGECMKKTVMELGGSDPYLILEDADLDLAAEACVTGRLINTGQSCIAAKRFIIVEAVRKPFEDKLLQLMQSKKTGDPLNPENDLGPIARADLRELLHNQCIQSIQKGARCLLGGKIPGGKGFFYPATLLTDVAPGMPAYSEELFGPVASVIVARNEEEAIRIANDTAYGLGGAVFSKDIARAERIARNELHCGNAFVNAFVKSDPRLPFGGVKLSGYGRELAIYGIREFTNIKTVFIR